MTPDDDRDRYEDYLTKKAKEILNEQNKESDRSPTDDPRPSDVKDVGKDTGQDKDSETALSEANYLARRREQMDNDDMRAFLEQDSDFHHDLEDAENLDFSRWEERVILQSYQTESVTDIAQELGRDEAAVRAKMRMLGLDVDTNL